MSMNMNHDVRYKMTEFSMQKASNSCMREIVINLSEKDFNVHFPNHSPLGLVTWKTLTV